MNEVYDKDHLAKLAYKLSTEGLNAEELAYFDKWYTSHDDTLLELPEGYGASPLEIRDRVHRQLLEKIGATAPRRRIIPIWTKLAGAAAVLLIAALSYFYLIHQPGGNFRRSVAQSAPILPGSNKAFLTLANGEKLSLTDSANGLLTSDAGVQISKTAGGQLVYTISGSQDDNTLHFNTIETPNGGQFQVHLPDGTNVWLNAATVLKYPLSFSAAGERVVELTGEAYFEVTKDPQRPFKVKSADQEVMVLGTHFNINSYPDEPGIRTTLLEGSVRVNKTVLRPGEQSILTNNVITVHTVNTADVIDWKSGDFIFRNENIRSIMRKLTRWYDIEVQYEGNVSNVEFGAEISRGRTLQQVLKILEKTGGVHFRTEGRKIIVIP